MVDGFLAAIECVGGVVAAVSVIGLVLMATEVTRAVADDDRDDLAIW